MKLTRRSFLIGSAAATATSLIGASSFASILNTTAAPSGNPLKIPSTIPGGTLAISATSTSILNGGLTQILSINTAFPAPTIRVTKDTTFTAHLLNGLSDDVVFHWHGLHVPDTMDGHPKYAIKPETSADITFPIINRAGTYFYHAHTDMKTAEQVYRGLAGCFIVDDPLEGGLNLPDGDFDIPLLISDKRFDTNHQLVYTLSDNDIMNGYLGDTILVNGTPDPYLEVSGTLYRFRIVNTSNARTYKLALDDNSEFTIIGSDGGLLTDPVKTRSCFLAPAERIDIIINFLGYLNGSILTLKSLPFFVDETPPPSPIPANGAEFPILRFIVSKFQVNNASIPNKLSVITTYNEADIKQSRSFRLGVDGMMHTINDKTFSMDRIDETIPFDQLEKWTFDNSFTTDIHPMHVHGTQYQVLRRSSGELQPNDLGWKDTVLVKGGEQVEVLVKFSDYGGLYLVHCHNLEHEDHGMMSNIMIEGGPDSVSERQSGNILQVYPNPASTTATVSIPDGSDKLCVYDLNGKEMIRHRVFSGTTSFELPVDRLPIGKYILVCGEKRALLSVVR